MAAQNYYIWKTNDTIWSVARSYFGFSGYGSSVQLAQDIRTYNPSILDWTAVPAGTRIFLPLIVMS